jgi:hypothetical protein
MWWGVATGISEPFWTITTSCLWSVTTDFPKGWPTCHIPEPFENGRHWVMVLVAIAVWLEMRNAFTEFFLDPTGVTTQNTFFWSSESSSWRRSVRIWHVWGRDPGKQLLAGAKEESLTVAGIFRGHHAEFPKRVEDGGSEFRHWWYKPRNSQIPTIWAAHWRNIAVLWDTTPKLWKPSKLHDKDSAIPIVRSFLKWIGSLSELYR